MIIIKIVCDQSQIVMFVVLMAFWSLYIFLELRENGDVTKYCSKCQIASSKSCKEDSNNDGIVSDSSLTTIEMPTHNEYFKQIDVTENGVLVLRNDQFVMRGFTQLSSIKKSVDNIFFVESSCVFDLNLQNSFSDEFMLDARQACGVESTARANPDRPIYILHSCPLAEDFAMRVPEHARVLLELHNVYIVVLDLTELSEGWSDSLPITSTSLGLLALWQFGGTYCDLDTLVLRSLQPLGTNYCGLQDNTLLVGDSVLSFEPLGYGHTVVTKLLNSLSEGFAEGVWKEDVSFITKVVDEQCSQLPVFKEDCNQLTIYDRTVLFTVGLTELTLFSNENLFYESVDRIKMTAYTINKLSRLYSFSEDKDNLTYAFTLAKEFCPDVYRRFQYTI